MSRIQITCDTPGAEIYYSINNDNLDQLYTIPFEMNEGGEIYAIGRKNGMEDSDVVNEIYFKINFINNTPYSDFIETIKNIGSNSSFNIKDYPYLNDLQKEGYKIYLPLSTNPGSSFSTFKYKVIREDNSTEVATIYDSSTVCNILYIPNSDITITITYDSSGGIG